MPLLAHEPQFIEVEVSDRVYGDTTLKQKARWVNMTISQDATTGFVSVNVKLRVFLFANDNGMYGEAISGKGLSTYDVLLVADNNTAVNPQTGEVRYLRVNETPEQWAALLAEKPEPLMLQGSFFETLLHAAPVQIEPMLRSFMQMADQAPFSKFS